MEETYPGFEGNRDDRKEPQPAVPPRPVRRRSWVDNRIPLVLAAVLSLIVLGIAVARVTGNRQNFPVRVQGKYGFIDKGGKLVVQPQFEDAGLFDHGLAPVMMGGKWGYVDRKGRLAIAPQFDVADPFSDGLALVGLQQRFGYIDTAGRMAINPQFAGAGRFVDGL